MAKAREGVEVVVLESPDGVGVPLEMYERAVDGRTATPRDQPCLLHQRRHPGRRGPVRDRAPGRARSAWSTATRPPGSSRSMSRRWTWTSTLAAGSSGCSVGPAWRSCTRPALTPTLHPTVTGWFAHREQFRFDSRALALHDDARRLEAGTPPLMPVYAQLGGLDILEEIGIPAVRAATAALTEDLIALATIAGLAPKVAPRPEHRSAIVMLPSPDPAADVRRLAERGVHRGRAAGSCAGVTLLLQRARRSPGPAGVPDRWPLTRPPRRTAPSTAA